MKKIMIALCAFAALSATAQTDSTKTKLKPYASACVSIGHDDPNDPAIDNFNKASYPSVELGLSGENVSLGAVFGFENFLVTSDTRPFYELKTSVSKPIGKASIYALFGVGAYVETGFNNFIEYGAGFSYMPGRVGYFVQYSKWARTDYVSTGLTFSFN